MSRFERYTLTIIFGFLLSLCFLVPAPTSAQSQVPQGGTGNTSFPAGNFLYGNAAGKLLSTSSPTVGYVTATSGTSTLPRVSIATAINFLGDYITNATTWVRAKIDAYLSGDEGIAYSSGSISFDCSEVEGTGINCVGEDVTLDATGDWTGTLDGYEASSFLANGFSTTSASYWAARGLSHSTTSADYWKTQNNFHSTTSASYFTSLGLSFSTTSANAWAAVGLGFSSTSATYWESTQVRWATTSANYHSSVGLTFSTTSAAYFSSLGLAFSTTSATHWGSQGLGFSTTSANVWRSVGLAFSTTSADYWETQQTARIADDLTNNSIEDLNDIAAMTESYGDLLGWNGSTWTDFATSTLFNTAASGVTGLLSGADWTTFNSKESVLTFNYPLSRSGNTISSAATSTAYGNLSSSLLFVNSAGVVTATTSLGLNIIPTCVQITGSADLCDGSDASGAGGSAWPFTPSTNFGVVVQSTSTPAWYTAGLVASSTSQFVAASTSYLSILSNWYTPQTGLIIGNGASTPVSFVTTSVTAGEILRVTGPNTYAWGALNLDDTDAFTGTLPIANTQLAVTYPIQLTTDTLSLAFGTTTPNTFSATQAFTNGFTFAATSTGSNGINLTDGCFAIDGTCIGAGGSGTPGGSDTQLQFNDGGSFGGDPGLTYNKTTDTITITNAGSGDSLVIDNNSVESVGDEFFFIADDNVGVDALAFNLFTGGAGGAGLNADNLTVDRIFTFPDLPGTFCILNANCVGTSTAHTWSATQTFANITATGATSTTLSTGTASTSDLWISNIRNGLLATGPTGQVVATTTPTATRFFATGATASVFPFASSTALSVSDTLFFSNASGTRATSTYFTATVYASTTALTVSNTRSAALITSATGAVSGASATSCTNQVVTAISAVMVGTCSSINNAHWSGADLSVANGGTGLSTFGGTNHVLYTTAADTLSSEAAFSYAAATDLLTLVNGSTTRLSIGTALFIPQSANETSTVIGQFSLDTTNGQLKVGSGSSQYIHDPRRFLSFEASSTAATLVGSTTQVIPMPTGMTLNSMQCKTDVGTALVQVSYGQPSTNLTSVLASTTMGTWTWSANNTPPAATTTTIVIGTPASSPGRVSCTISVSVTGT